MNPLHIALLAADARPEMSELAIGLGARGHLPRLILANGSFAQPPGIPVTRAWHLPERRLDRRAVEVPLTHALAAYLVLRRSQTCLAHAFAAPDAVAAARWSQRSGRPAVFSLLELADRAWLVARRGRLALVREAIRRCAVTVVPSHFAARELERALGVRARVIHPPVKVRESPELGPRDERITVFSPTAPSELIAAFRSVRCEHPEARLLVRFVDAANAGEPGIQVVHDDALGYRRAWITIDHQGGGTFPARLVESLATGRPIVAVSGEAGEEVLESFDVGALAASGRPEDLARAILGALALADRPETKAACQQRAADFSIESCAATHEELYAELLGSVPAA